MSDFFEELERQLRDATRQRPRRMRRARRRRAATAASAIVLIAGGGVALAAGLATNDRAPRAGTPAATQTTLAPTPDPQAFTVAVLNGTTTPGLARGVANALTARGFRVGVVTNAPQQTRTRTRVYFRAGHADDARSVTGALLRGRDHGSAPARVSASLAAFTGGDADVVVIVGSRLLPRTSSGP